MRRLLFAFVRTIKDIITEGFKALKDMPDYLYRLFVIDPWSSVGSLLIYEVASYILNNHNSGVYIDWRERGYFKNLSAKYLLLFPISEVKIKYFFKKTGVKEKTYSIVHCEDIAINKSTFLRNRHIKASDEIIAYTVPVFYLLFFYSIFTILFQVAFTFYFDFVPIHLRDFSFVMVSYLISIIPVWLVTLAIFYIRIRRVMPRKSAIKFVAQMSLASIITFPVYVFLYAVCFAYEFIAFLNIVMMLIKRTVWRVKYGKDQANYTMLLSIQKEANGLFKGMDPMDIFFETFMVNADIKGMFSDHVHNICSTSKESLNKILDKLQMKESGASINKDMIIYSLQDTWRYGIVLLSSKLYRTTIANLKRQLNVDKDGYIDPEKAKDKPIETFAFAMLKNKPNYIFLFVMTLPVLILVRNLLSILPFFGRGKFHVLPAEFHIMKEVYDSIKKKYDCNITKGCLLFSHVYLPDFGVEVLMRR